MALKIIISSAVELLEKTSVKSKLQEMEKNHLIKIDELYDCNEHGVFWDITPKQEEINRFIVNADWFICLLPEYQVGKATWEELKLAIEAQKNGAKIVISVFHPKDFPNEKKTEEVPDKKVTYEFVEAEAKRIYGSELHQYFEPYEYGNNEDLLQKVEDHYAKAYKDRKFWSLHVGGNAIRGIEVKARDLFFDKLRAEAEWGFREGQDVYIWRNSVDGKMNQRLNRYGCRFLFITGRPSSGKSRALYEFTHSTLKDQQVVLMGADNVVSICDSLMVDVRQAKRDPEQSYAKAFCQTQYYFVCDQINDVFQQAQVPTELKLGFLNAISEQENCCLLATGTRAALEDFVEDSRDIISPIDGNYNDGNSDLITIPLLSKDADSQEILARLRHQYSISDGETIGDFITELNKYKAGIVEEILKAVKQEKFQYLSDFLKCIQLTLTYRHITPLLLPVNMLRNHYDDSGRVFKRRTVDCLNFLIAKNVLKITDSKKERQEIGIFPENVFSASEFCLTTLLDDEEYPEIVPTQYTFTVNELVWVYLQERLTQQADLHVLFNLFDEEELSQALPMVMDSYPHAATLRRFVSRTPIQREWQDSLGDKKRLRISWQYAFQMMKRLKAENESEVEMNKAFNILIGRAENVGQVDELLALMADKGLEVNDSTIGEMYTFAQHRLEEGTPEFDDFIKKTEELDKQQQRRDYERGCAWTFQDLYRISKIIRLKKNNYAEAFSLVSDAFYKIKCTDAQGHPLQGRNAIMYLNTLDDSLDKRSLEYIMILLAKRCNDEQDVERLLKCHIFYKIRLSNYVLHRIGDVVKDSATIYRLLEMMFKAIDDEDKRAAFYERAVVCVTMHLRTFQESITLYKRWHQYMVKNKRRDKNQHNIRLVSICLQNCKREEFQTAVAFIRTLPKNAINGITYNLLISLAPNTEDIIFLVNRMRSEDVDEYTLSNCLKRIDEISQINRGKGEPKIDKTQWFIFAYEMINHPKLKGKRTRMACLQKLFKLVTDPWQEAFIIEKIVGPKRQWALIDNDYINSTRVIRPYRTFTEAYELIYLPARARYDDTKGKFWPDLINSMCAKYYKDNSTDKDKYKEELQRDIERYMASDRIILDENFFLNYYIKFLGTPIFNADGTLTELFKQWFAGKQGNVDISNLSALSKLLAFIANQYYVDVETRWQQMITLYLFYKERFAAAKSVFHPQDDVFISMLVVASKRGYPQAYCEFIDQELLEHNVERTQQLNSKLSDEKTGYNFKYNEKHPQPVNRHMINILHIQTAKSTEQVMDVLQQEIKKEGFVTPSIINCALERYRDFQRQHASLVGSSKKVGLPVSLMKYIKDTLPAGTTSFNLSQLVANYRKNNKKHITAGDETDKLLALFRKHNTYAKDFVKLGRELAEISKKLDMEELQEIVRLISEHELSLTSRCHVLLTVLSKDSEDRKHWIDKFQHCSDISETAYGQLSTEPIIAQTSIELSREYFRRWLAVYKDIYGTYEVIARILPQRKWSTIGLHLKNETKALEDLRKRAKLTAKEQLPDFLAHLEKYVKQDALDIIDEILHTYAANPQHFTLKNFPQWMTLDDVATLLGLYQQRPDYWQDLTTKLTCIKSNTES